jgi:phosphoglycerate dehydrogenase-like enzyme
MLKVGVPEAVDPALHRLLPSGVALEVIPMKPQRAIDVEFWIAPPWTRQARDAWPWLRGVRVVQATVAGVEDLIRFLPRDVILCDARGAHNVATAEWTLAVILAMLKYLPLYGEVRRVGLWSGRKQGEAQYRALHSVAGPLYPNVLVEELYGQRILIVGYGAIGRAIEDRLTPFGVEILRVARTARDGVFAATELHLLIPTADIIILIVPATAETTGMIGPGELAAMKQGALLVNAARGSVVQTEALLAALRSGRIRAALDVTDPEPLPEGHPLWSAPNLLITPHVAGSTPMFMRRAIECAAAQVGRYLRGEPLENIVTGDY